MKVLTLASVFLTGALIGAHGYPRAVAQDATGVASVTPTPQPQKTTLTLPNQQPSVAGVPQAAPQSTQCMPLPRKISTLPGSATLTVRAYLEWVSLERKANGVVKDTLTKLTGQAFPTAATHCAAPHSAP